MSDQRSSRLDRVDTFVRLVQTTDVRAWGTLWHRYCAELDGAVSDAIAAGVWQRIFTTAEPIGCLLACGTGGELVSAGYLHPHTWSP